MYKYNKPGPNIGETFTVTCFCCSTPSSKEWAQLVQSRPYLPDLSVPFFPFLLQTSPPPGALFSENGSTYLCAFCHALLESQWNAYEGKKEIVTPLQRKYVTHKFICAVCGVETYRKRVRALPFQEFPFLSKTRQPGSITLGNNPLAVVCLDCSETLWAQSAEYDRWGLPVHKRHFNWMARPPPPEDSMEATVARLPSGETQLPRCPPTDPTLPPRTNEPTAVPETIPPIKYVRPRANSNVGLGARVESVVISQHQSISKYNQQLGHRQGSPLPLTRPQISPHKNIKALHGYSESTNNVSTLGANLHVQPPVVTVAPMSLQNAIAGGSKNSLIYTLSHIEEDSPSKYHHQVSHGRSYSANSQTSHHALQFPQHLVPYYSPVDHYSWPGGAEDDDVSSEYTPTFDDSSGTNRHHRYHSIPWRQRELPTNPHQHYPQPFNSTTGIHSRDRGLTDPNLPSPPSLIGHPLSLSTLFPQLRLQSTPCSSSAVRVESPISSQSRSSSSVNHFHNRNPYSSRDYEICRTPNSCRNVMTDHVRIIRSPNSPKHRHPIEHGPFPSHNSSEDESSRVRPTIPTRTTISSAVDSMENIDTSLEYHHRSVQNRSSPFVDILDPDGGPGGTPEERRTHKTFGCEGRRDFLVPKKRHWEPSVGSISGGENVCIDDENKVLKPNTSELCSVLEKKRKVSMNLGTSTCDYDDNEVSYLDNNKRDKSGNTECGIGAEVSTSNKHCAIDLSMSQKSHSSTHCRVVDYSSSQQQHNRLSPSSKFSIAYLSKSESLPVVLPPVSRTEPLIPFNSSTLERATPAPTSSEDDDDANIGDCSHKIVKDSNKHFPHNAQFVGVKVDDVCPTIGKQNEMASTTSENVSTDETDFMQMVDSFTQKTIEYFIEKEEEARTVLNEIRTKQQNFLHQLGLITPKEKMGLGLTHGSEQQTVLPLKFRESPSQVTGGPLESSKSTVVGINAAQASFLQSLGLRPSTFAERFQRQAKMARRITTVPPNYTDHEFSDNNRPSSDFRSDFFTQGKCGMEEEDSRTSTNPATDSASIKYPIFVPGVELRSDKSIKCDHVLRIPVVHKQIISIRNDNSSTDDDDISHSENGDTCPGTAGSSEMVNDVENILKMAELHWRKIRNLLARAMNETKSTYPIEKQLVQVHSIRKHLTMQHSEIQITGNVFQDLEKQVFKKFESVSKNRQSLPP